MSTSNIFLSAMLLCLCPGNCYYIKIKSAKCYVTPDPSSSQNVSGTVMFTQWSPDQPLKVRVDLGGFDAANSEFEHGFHVHEKGDISGGCSSTGGHYNPDQLPHGGPADELRHAGDFGNLQQTSEGNMSATFTDNVATLYGEKSIIGRAIVVHARRDDLGRGQDYGSVTTGNAGPRLGCCVIIPGNTITRELESQPGADFTDF